jgi:predicted kinase
MWRAGISPSDLTHHAAYLVVEALAAGQLALGGDVIIDAVNGPKPARAQWRDLAARMGAELRFIVGECGDDRVFRDRVEHRTRTIEGLP